MLDWLAFYEISPFGPERDDIRAAAQVVWMSGGFKGMQIEFPYAEAGTSEEEELEFIEAIEAIRQRDTAETASQKGEDHDHE